jgi:chemotaxis protein methyltransferase CheR
LAALNQAQFRMLCDYLYRETGIAFADDKEYFVTRRLAERMLATQRQDFARYFAELTARGSAELQHFINAFTINETYFYREDYQLRCLTGDLLQSRVAGKKPGEALRIWSVPCSTGEEPYSIAVWMLENWDRVDDFEIEIVGSDIDTNVLVAAREGIYGERAVMRLDARLLEKYFERAAPEQWRVIEDLRGSVLFAPVNVVEPAEMRRFGRFDVIFCRNMLIYFDEASRRIAAENLYEALLPGGYLCLGHAESMSRISSLFEVCRFDDAIVYRRPPEVPHG